MPFFPTGVAVLRMQPYETLGLPSPDECIGVVGLTTSLLILTIGIVVHLFVVATIWSFALIVAGLFIGWVSIIYCGLWSQRTVPGG